MIHLVLGGARSGKSTFAEQWIKDTEADHPALPVYYLATATPGDEEMAVRIARHQRERPEHWHTLETPLQLGPTVQRLPRSLVIIDCMTLWLNNWLCGDAHGWSAAKHEFFAALGQYPGTIVIVSNEVGSGIVPLGTLSRQFVDEAGWLNQALAQLADRVTLVVAGCALDLKA